ncbi:hypothetical protein [Streptomyces sp. SPB162]|uniref:hypothetical protein n=1 Tax=Streptomyces sp. SPB162 TaxID=2940560 RepID=UPI002406C434|nr:hypothetical protein [Streptomyces sp. SPB162]MDF9817132.1 hypothetical protein [Streptomyces sp. SPB162]
MRGISGNLALPVEKTLWPKPYYIRLVAERLRGLAGGVPLARAEALGEDLAERLGADDAAFTDGIQDDAAWRLAMQVMDGIGLRWNR